MLQKLLWIVAVTMFFTLVRPAYADIVINEFMSDPASGPEWIEFRNNSSEDIDLSLWKWTEIASPGGETEHESSLKSLSGNIAPGGLYVLEINNALNNGGDSIGLYRGSSEVSRVTFGSVSLYSPNLEPPIKGKSGALINGTWKTDQEPTKGLENPTQPSLPPGGGSESSDGNPSDTGSSGKTASKTSDTAPKTYPIKIEIIAGKTAHAGIPFSFEGRGTGETGSALTRGKYFWNFGDGDFREARAGVREKFTHTYFYPGEYSVVLDYYGDSFSEDPVGSDQALIRVIKPDIMISRVGGPEDFFVEISNSTDSSADISGWMLLSAYKVFTFPKNTVIGANKKMILAPSLSRFGPADAQTLRLMTPDREIVFSYAGDVSEPKTQNSLVSQRADPVLGQGSSELQEAAGDSLRALAFGGAGENKFERGSSNGWIGFAGFAAVLGGAIGLLYFIRRKRISLSQGEDFEILDE